MPIINTSNIENKTTFIDAAINSIPSGGLWMFDSIQPLPDNFFTESLDLSFKEITYKVITHLLNDEPYHNVLTDAVLLSIVNESFNFDIVLQSLDDSTFMLECFHGPTLTFKDFGCRFLAKLIQAVNPHKNNIVLVATSGDTGSAVADAFYNMPNYKVVILYPKDKVSVIQKLQMTTYGKNIIPIAIAGGTFDDCQTFVKSLLRDEDFTHDDSSLHFISSNSVNIARLIPQITYYVYAYIQLLQYNNKHSIPTKKLLISVPSGNCGNITGCMIAKQLGIPVDMIIAAQNTNNTFVEWIHTGSFQPKKSTLTISNAMDVGNPSNFKRIEYLYPFCPKHLTGYTINEQDILTTIKNVYERYNYIIDTHTAVAYCSKNIYCNNTINDPDHINSIDKTNNTNNTYQSIIVSTSHPIKFIDKVEDAIPELKDKVTIPTHIQKLIKQPKDLLEINNNYEQCKQSFHIMFNHPSPSNKKPTILLIGFPGCGKSTISKYIHTTYTMNTIDVDSVIEKNHKMDLFTVIRTHGEQKFKKIEELSIIHILESSTHTIISPGGSVIYYPSVFECCKKNNIVVVYLQTNLDTLLERTENFTNRGIVGLDDIPSFYKKRNILYRKYANIMIDCNNQSVSYIGDLLFNRLLH